MEYEKIAKQAKESKKKKPKETHIDSETHVFITGIPQNPKVKAALYTQRTYKVNRTNRIGGERT